MAELEICIEGMIGKLPHLSREQCCIYRVPKRLRDINEKAYTPEIVSIGPLHRGSEDLHDMEEQKLRSLQALLRRPRCASLIRYTSEIRNSEAKIRRHYDETIEPTNSDEFVKMILFDSTFIIQVMLNKPQRVPQLTNRIKRDMTLLENQIPFFIIERLFNIAYPNYSQGYFLQLCFKFFGSMFLVEGLNYSESLLHRRPSHYEVKHFVDLLRLYHLSSPSFPRLKPHSKNVYMRIKCATQLKEAGIKFRNKSTKWFLDIHYDKKKKMLEIPQLIVWDCTESVLRNMVALEQFQYLQESYITDYAIFLDYLIDTSKDADILIQNQIIRNDLADSSAVSKVFNNLSDEISLSVNNYSYHDISQELDTYCKSSWNRWKAILKHDYLRTPWMIGSTIAAIVLLVLTLIQAICSIIEVA